MIKYYHNKERMNKTVYIWLEHVTTKASQQKQIEFDIAHELVKTSWRLSVLDDAHKMAKITCANCLGNVNTEVVNNIDISIYTYGHTHL